MGLDRMRRSRHIGGSNVLEIKRSGGVRAWGGDRDSCEQLDDPALARWQKPTSPFPGWFATDSQRQPSGDEKKV